ncbi:MAG: amidohydrolase family protein [Terriglobales bacterium]
MHVDAHQHFWQWSKGWFSRPEAVLSRDYMPRDFEPILKAHGIDASVVVQTSPTTAETDFLLQLAETSSFIRGVVGWLNLESSDFPSQLERYRRKRSFVAVRPMLESLPEDNWILRPLVLESLSRIAESGLAFEFLTFPRHLPYVVQVLDRIPRLRAVIDHLSKPEIKARKMQPWKDLVREVALRPNVYCKLSGMMTEADPSNWSREQLRPYADHVMEHFGGERVMFGSDWPVCLLAASYEEVLAASKDVVMGRLGTVAVDAVFGGNAVSFYRLEPSHPTV